MKTLVSILLVSFTVLAIFSGVSSALQRLNDLSDGLPQGLKVYKYRSDDKRAVLYVAEMDRRSYPSLQFWTCVARGRVLGRTTVRDMVQKATKNGKNVLVAVNGSFGVLGGSYEGVIHNLHIQNSMVISPPNHFSCFGVTKSGEFLMESVKMNISVKLAGQEISIRGLNEERRNKRSVVLYTPRFGGSTRTNDGCEVIISDVAVPLTPKYRSKFTVREVRDSGNTEIPKDGFVLSTGKGSDEAKLLSGLKPGDQGELTLSFLPGKWDEVVQGIGGNSRLVKNGNLCDEAHRGNNSKKDDPRTALGYNDKKLFLMVVDGRQSGYSNGMSYVDVAKAMMELGATEAINLDGGSSSTFVVRDKVVNRPSGGKERHVLNALLITSGEPVSTSAE